LARKCQKPRIIHWKAAQRLLSYLRNTIDIKLVFRKQQEAGENPLNVECSSDADFAGDRETRRSTSGNVITVCGAAIHASSKRQPTVADSTVAAEIISLYSQVKTSVWLRNLLDWIGYHQIVPMVIYCDNMGAIRNCEDGAERHHTKHMDIKYMFIRDIVQQGLVQIRYQRTENMVADLLTKPLRRNKFEHGRKLLGLMKGSV
jgi:hypothetical protein